VFAHACALGLEGIVSKREGSLYKSGRSRNWLKTKNPDFR
jgi:bifunctional non-homologous end joining protein LigD